MSDKKKSYKEENGTTRVGDFLRTLNLKENLPNILNAGFDIVSGDFKGALGNFITDNEELTEAQRIHALKLLESDVKEQEEITKRWVSDNQTNSKLTKNIRPLTLAFLTVSLVVLIILDSSNQGFTIEGAWIDLLKSLLLTVFVAYFGGRSYEKSKKL